MTSGRREGRYPATNTASGDGDVAAQARLLGADIAAVLKARLGSDPVANLYLKEFLGAVQSGLADSDPTRTAYQERSTFEASKDAQHARIETAREARLSEYGPSNPRAVRVFTAHESPETGEVELVLDIEGSGLEGHVGDRVALCPRNDPEEVRRILRTFNVRGVEVLTTDFGSGPAWRVLLEDVDIAHISDDLREHLLLRLASRDEARLVDDFIRGADPRLLTLVRRFPHLSAKLTELVPHMQRLEPIFGYVLETVGPSSPSLRVFVSDAARLRATSTGISLSSGNWIPIYVEASTESPLTWDAELPLVIIADELGITLAKSYVAERRSLGHRGRCWIIALGPRHDKKRIDVMQQWQREGILTRLDVANTEVLETDPSLSNTEEMLWRWFVDKSAFLLVGKADSGTAKLEALTLRVLASGAHKDPSWFEGPLNERRAAALYRTLGVA